MNLAYATKLRWLREAKSFTQEELAKAAGIHTETVRNAEKGKGVQVETLNKLAVALGIKAAALLDEEDG